MKFFFPLMMGLILLSNLYILVRIWQILPCGAIWEILILLAYLAALACMFLGFGHWDSLPVKTMTIVYEIGNTWLIAYLYLLIAFVLLDLGRLVHLVPASFLKGSLPGALTVFGAVALTLCLGGIHYHHKYREEMTLTTDKPLEKPVTIVMASDLHLGYHNRRPELARWIDLINAEHPDLVLFGGDIIDISVRPLLEGNYAEAFHRLQAPVWSVLGNHEYYSNEPRAEAFYRDAGIRLIRDSVAWFGDIAVVGRDDRTNPERKTLREILAAAPEAEGHLTLLLDHQPNHLEEAEAAGIDFQFSGHTHRGQVWPISWVTDAMFEKSWGHHRRGNTRYYVSSGLGIWGAKIRVGTRSEYLVLHIRPDSPSTP